MQITRKSLFLCVLLFGGAQTVCFGEKPFFVLKDSLSQKEQNQIKEAFLKNNGISGDEVRRQLPRMDLHRFSGIVKGFGTWKSSGKEPSSEEAVQVAEEFLEHNAAFLGLTPAHLKQLEIEYRKTTFGNVSISVARPLSYPGYEKFTDFGFSPKMYLNVQGGTVVGLLYGFPPVMAGLPDLETAPRLSEDDALIRQKLIGRDMTYTNAAGKSVSAGKVEAADIVSETLTIAGVQKDDHGKIKQWIGLAYKIRVQREGLKWEFIFSAENGDLIAVYPLFWT